MRRNADTRNNSVKKIAEPRKDKEREKDRDRERERETETKTEIEEKNRQSREKRQLRLTHSLRNEKTEEKQSQKKDIYLIKDKSRA